jgi:hypothetical protein
MASLKSDLLAHYAETYPTMFWQFDGFYDLQAGDIMDPDDVGDSVIRHSALELMSGLYGVRVLVTAGTTKVVALRLLDKIRAAIEHYGEDIFDPWLRLTVAIKHNNTPGNAPCPICGKRTDANEGPELFLVDSQRPVCYGPVCYGCGERYAPELVKVLRDASGSSARADDDLGFLQVTLYHRPQTGSV